MVPGSFTEQAAAAGVLEGAESEVIGAGVVVGVDELVLLEELHAARVRAATHANAICILFAWVGADGRDRREGRSMAVKVSGSIWRCIEDQ
jgi:hypothetical protein